MAEPSEEITELLREANAADPAVREFAWVWLDAFRRDAADVLRLAAAGGPRRCPAGRRHRGRAGQDGGAARPGQAPACWADYGGSWPGRDTGRSAGTGGEPTEGA
jgi:hypothetical protein